MTAAPATDTNTSPPDESRPAADGIVTTTRSPEKTIELGRRIGAALEPRDLIALSGPLGAGKTMLVKGLALGLGATSRVTSPTFKLVNEYPGRVRLYHLDAYRLSTPEDLLALGCDEFFDGDGAAVVEWADRVAPALPPDRLDVRIDITGPHTRRFNIAPTGPRSRRLAASLKSRPHKVPNPA